MRLTDQVYQQYKKTTPTQKSYLSLALSLALMIFLIVITYPAVQHILELQREISDGNKTLKQLLDKEAALATAANNYEAMKPDFPLIDLAMPVGTNLQGYVQKPIESLGGGNHLALAGLQFSNVPLSTPSATQILKPVTLPYSLTLVGNFTDFANFLAQVEKYIRVTQVSSVALTAKNGGQVSADMKLTTQYFNLGSRTTISGGGQ